MSVSEISLATKELYGRSIAKEAFTRFERALDHCYDVDELERLAVEDVDWQLPTDMMLLLLYKAKRLGASSEDFQKQYYGYLAAHLDPGEEQAYAYREIKRLMGSD